MSKRVAIYSRVSTERQTVANQVIELRAWAITTATSSRAIQARSLAEKKKVLAKGALGGQRLEVLTAFKEAAKLACSPEVDISPRRKSGKAPRRWRAAPRKDGEF